jgi:aspartate kinase
LGREGSDYSAAIFAACLNAEEVTIWKDVPGVLNADPKWFANTELIPELSYTDAIELTYYGATVIHPKTIKPLQNKKISLNVRSFLNPGQPGTTIRTTNQTLPIPSFIFKVNQVFINIQPRDFSFIVEDNLSHIFNLFHLHRIKINMMHNSAISFSVSIDDTGENIDSLLNDLQKRYKVNVEKGLELITIRYYNQETIERVLENKKIIRELKDGYTCQMLVKNLNE